MQKALEAEANRLVAASGHVGVEMALPDRVTQLVGNFPDYLPKDSEARMVNVGGVWCPCGGTHVGYVLFSSLLLLFVFVFLFILLTFIKDIYILDSHIYLQKSFTNWCNQDHQDTSSKGQDTHQLCCELRFGILILFYFI